MSSGSSSEQQNPSPEWKPSKPNILITGTPGVGKTALSSKLALELGMRHIEVGQFARERDLLADFDEKLDTYFMHEDAVLDELEPLMLDGGVILDHHSVDWFPERWIQIAVVLRTSTHILYDRLSSRNYGKIKLDNNMEAEIMQVILDEAKTSYPKLNVLELINNYESESNSNIIKIKTTLNKLNNSASESQVDYDQVH